MQITGKTALLTGATGGLGIATARALASRGARLVLSSRREDELTKLAESLPGDGHTYLVSDLAEEGAAEKLFADAEAAGPIDILIANAALPGSGNLISFTPEQVARGVRVNLEVPMILSRLFIPPMTERGGGQIVLISSLSGKAASPRASIYNATKFGLRGFGLALRQDQVADRSGVGVSVVMPGFVRDAGMFESSGGKAPPGVGTVSPEQVGEGVVRAIEADKAEVQVATPQQRMMVAFAHRYPRLAALTQRGHGTRLAERMAEGNRDKR